MAFSRSLERGGLVLFFLVYLYVWFKHYLEIQAILAADTGGKAVWEVIWNSYSTSGVGWEIVGATVIIFLVFLALVMTCFRALSFASKGISFDAFPLQVAFRWVLQVPSVQALLVGCLMTTLLVWALIWVSQIAAEPASAMKPGDGAEWYPVRYLVYLLRKALVPDGALTTPVAIRKTLLECILLLNLLGIALLVVMTCTDMKPQQIVPRRAMQAMRSHNRYTLNDYLEERMG